MRWTSYSSYLKNRFGMNVFRIGVDAGFSCPNRDASRYGGCTFCDGTGAVAVYQRKGEGVFHHDSPYDNIVASSVPSYGVDMKGQIERGREFLSRRYGAEGFSLYLQSFTNTYAPRDVLRRIYDEALGYGDFKEFIISTRPDCLDDDVVDLIAEYKDRNYDVWVELGLQSASDRTLKHINRGHDVACYVDAFKRLKERGILVSTHVIIGLPGEDIDDFCSTADLLARLKTDAVKIHNLHIAGGTAMADEYERGEIRLLSAEEYIQAVALFLSRLSPGTIIQRLISETPAHRLIAPRDFPDKSRLINMLDKKMEEEGLYEGCLYQGD